MIVTHKPMPAFAGIIYFNSPDQDPSNHNIIIFIFLSQWRYHVTPSISSEVNIYKPINLLVIFILLAKS